MGKNKPRKNRDVEVVIKYNTSETNPKKYGTPETLASWDVNCLMSKECEDMMAELSDIVYYICLKLNDGPDVKDSFMKRTILLKSIISQLIYGTWLNGYLRYGLLAEMMHDLYMDTGGKGKIFMAMVEFNVLKVKQEHEAAKKKTRYVA